MKITTNIPDTVAKRLSSLLSYLETYLSFKDAEAGGHITFLEACITDGLVSLNEDKKTLSSEYKLTSYGYAAVKVITDKQDKKLKG